MRFPDTSLQRPISWGNDENTINQEDEPYSYLGIAFLIY
jgi:hypothetical protein